MVRPTHALPALLIVLAGCVTVPKNPSVWHAPPSSARVANAADLYTQAWQLESSQTDDQAKNEICAPGRNCQLNDDWLPSPALARSLESQQPAIKKLLEASRIERCDFATNYSAFPDLQLPHLTKLRTSARLLSADAVRALLAGDPDAAADRVAAMYAISNHAIDNHTEISALFSAGISRLADDAVTRLCAGAQPVPDATPTSTALTPTARQRLLRANTGHDPADPFGYKRCLAGEKQLWLAWLDTFRDLDAGVSVAHCKPLLDSMSPDQRAAFAASTEHLNADGVRTAARKLAALYDSVLAVWDRPDARDRMKQLTQQASRGDFGPLAQYAAFGPARAYANHAESLRERQAAAARLTAPAAPSPHPPTKGSGT
jgi:hypothetical protein